MSDEWVRAVLLTGPVGSGKTVVAMELGELLAERGLATAVIDLDWLGWFHAGSAQAPSPDEMIADNLRAIWPRYRAAGVRYLVLARALTTRAQVEAVASALPSVHLTVALIIASPDEIARRLGGRDEGAVLQEHLDQSSSMARALEKAGLEDLRIENDERPARAAATELLREMGWGEGS